MEKFTCKVASTMTWPAKLETQNGLVLDFSKPPEYNGMHGTLTPEDAFVASVITCLACTFDSLANKMRLKVSAYESDGTGVVDRINGIEKFSEMTVNVKIKIPEETNRDSVKKAIEKAQANCLVAASMSTPVKYNIYIETV
ncbi:MAG: OsmC family protein [Thermoplasmata archaeon]|nr:OsmC family protein [Thermoplasmata archaeon]